MQFEINEFVMYKFSGVCRIESIEKKCFDGVNEISYYKLKPLDNNRSSCYIPVENSQGKIRRLLSEEEVYSIIDSMPEEHEIWCDDSRERKAMFSRILKSDDYKIIVGMIKALHQHQAANCEKGKRLSGSDEAALNNAEKIMYQEFAVVLGIAPDEVEEKITNRIDDNKGRNAQ
jgi:CarD family transcriptional regulator